jgi:Holliday junction resolvasome RuvABC endonuclease subunit
MDAKTILSIDLSTKTGWAVIISSDAGAGLVDYGMIRQIPQPDGPYPSCFVDWAYLVFNGIEDLIKKFKPDMLAIEETVAGSKAVYSQKILEYSHFLLAKHIKDSNIESIYLLTGAWRSEVGAKMTKEESKHNKEVKAYKTKHGTKLARDINGKILGKLTKKHINIRRANEVFGPFLKEPLRKKNEDEADALLLALALHLRRLKGNKSEEVTMEDLIEKDKI